MSFYAEYIREQTHGDIIETEHGFATYVFLDAQTCYIRDIFVTKEAREQGKASSISAVIEDLARSKGCTKLVGSVIPSAKNSTRSLKVLLAYGFELASASPDLIMFEKRL